MKNLMRGTLAENNRRVSIQINDKGNLLFDDKSNEDAKEVDPNPLFSKQVEIALYGRVWAFSIQSNLSFRQESTTSQSSYILVGGLFIDGLLLALFIFLSKANRQALSYADQMTKALEEKTRHLEKSNSDLEQFSYVASHDLKSPLNAIKQLVNWISEDCKEILPTSSKKHLNLLSLRSERMMKLLDDLLDYSRINRTEFKNVPVNLNDAVIDILELLEKPNGFTITAPNIEIVIPQTPFEIVIRNLISNSIKHHDKDSGYIDISYEKSDEFHSVIVKDDGPGIPEKFHEQVTEMFQTLKSRDIVEGSGMGLAVVKSIMDHYQGKLVINSDGVRGTEIVLNWKK
jgi:signal transduction histidine kinase